MELKLSRLGLIMCVSPILIVPYGIETDTTLQWIPSAVILIVPYGIETIFSHLCIVLWFILIVPYGIETIKTLPC